MNVMDNRIEADGATSSKPPAMTKAMVIVLLAVAVIMGGIFGWQRFIGKMIGKSISGQASIPQKVSTIVAAASVWQSRTQALGTVRAVRGADLAAQASGVVDTIHIESGTKVGAGTVLLTLKPNDDPAKLAQLRAQAELAAVTLKRDQEQLAAEAVSQATVDADSANLKSARAQVAAQEALIEEKTVRAPFAGTLGVRQVDEGQYLAAGSTVVTLQALDPVYIDFYVPQQALSHLKVGQTVGAAVDAYPQAAFPGTITSINSKVDSSSRNVQVRAPSAIRRGARSRHVRKRRDRQRQRRLLHHATGLGHCLQSVRRHGVRRAANRVRQGPPGAHRPAAFREARRHARGSGGGRRRPHRGR